MTSTLRALASDDGCRDRRSKGRRIRVGTHWLCDFASCNYLDSTCTRRSSILWLPELKRWGTHPSWSRLLGNPRLYVDIEEQLTSLLRAPDTLVLPTITIIHTSMIPVLAGQGAVLIDSQAHKTMYQGGTSPGATGATLAMSGRMTLSTSSRSFGRSPRACRGCSASTG